MAPINYSLAIDVIFTHFHLIWKINFYVLPRWRCNEIIVQEGTGEGPTMMGFGPKKRIHPLPRDTTIHAVEKTRTNVCNSILLVLPRILNQWWYPDKVRLSLPRTLGLMNKHRTGKRTYSSKVRRITACSECYRRKQRCNRERPCNGCVLRGVSNKCTYKAASSPQQSRSPESMTSTGPNELSVAVEPSHISAISLGIGYVETGGTGAPNPLNMLTPACVRSGDRRRSATTLSRETNDKLLELFASMPEPSLTQRLINVFFSQANWYFSVLDRCFFDQRYRKFLMWHQSDARDQADYENSYIVALSLQIIAIALHFLPKADRSDEVISSFAIPSADSKSVTCSEAGESILTLLGRRHADLSSIEADIMRCASLKNSGHGLEAWHSIGNAIRQAQDCRLHLEPVLSAEENMTVEHTQDLWHCEHKRRTWACLLAWEAHMALQLGRPRTINISDCTTTKPRNCDAPRDTSRTLLRDQTLSTEVPSHYTSHIVKYEVALMIHRAMNAGMLRPETGNAERVKHMHSEVKQLLFGLPPAFRQPNPDTSWDTIYPDVPKLRLQIQVIVDSFLLALHRPYVFTDPDSLRMAVQAAKNVLDISQKFFDIVEENQHKNFTMVFYTIDAGIFLAVAMARLGRVENAHGISHEPVVETLETSVRRLEFLERFHIVATTGKEILRKCLNQLNTRLNGPSFTPMPPTPGPTATPADNPAGFDMAWTLDADDSGDFWLTLLNDPAYAATWLNSHLDSSVSGFDPFSENPLLG